jgi:hypothetical protein
VLHLPRTKSAGNEGEDVYWASQNGDTDPTAALEHHLQVNQPSETSHLFAYKAKHTRRPLTKAKFLGRVQEAACLAGLDPLQGHGIKIGSTLEYLLRGVPFDVMKAKGRWAGDSFQLYLRKHAIVIAPTSRPHLQFTKPLFGTPCPQCARVPTYRVSSAYSSISNLGVSSLTRRVMRFLTGRVSRPRLGHQNPPIFDREALRASAHSLCCHRTFPHTIFCFSLSTLVQSCHSTTSKFLVLVFSPQYTWP